MMLVSRFPLLVTGLQHMVHRLMIYLVVSAGCSNFPAPTDDDPDECSGECLTKLGSPAADVISISNLTIAGVDADMMRFTSNSTTLPQIGGNTQAA